MEKIVGYEPTAFSSILNGSIYACVVEMVYTADLKSAEDETLYEFKSRHMHYII